MQVFLAWDGDHVGREVGQAALADDVEGLRRISQSIDHGNEVLKAWVINSGGSTISMGGDEGRAEVPADKLEDLPRIREQYRTAVGSTLSIGVGMKMSDSNKALIAAKLQGGDQVVFYSPACEEIIKEAEAKQPNEAQKIVDAYLSKGEVIRFPSEQVKEATDKGKVAPIAQLPIKEPGTPDPRMSEQEAQEYNDAADDLLMSPAAHAANKQKLLQERAQTRKAAGFRGFNPGDDVEHVGSGRAGKVMTHEGPVRMPGGAGAKHVYGVQLAGQRGVTHVFEDEIRLHKDEGSAGAVGGFKAHRAVAPSKAMSPEPQQSQHSEAQDVYNLMSEERPPAPEATHAAQDFEKMFHDAAQEQSQKEQVAAEPPAADAIKTKVAQILQQVKAQAPVLEQMRQSVPDTYQAVVDMAQAVIAMAKELPQSNGPSVKKSESPLVKAKKEEPEPQHDLAHTLTEEVRDALTDELRKPEYRGKSPCTAGHCYVASEAIHEMLGGEHSGWQPMHVKHEGGPHWFLMHKTTGRILDPTADQFRTSVPYDKAIPKGFIQYRNPDGRLVPSKRAQVVVSRVLGERAGEAKKTEREPNERPVASGVLDKDMEKASTMNGLPLPKSPKKVEHPPLPVGTTIEGEGRFKVQHNDGSKSWKEGRSGVIRSQDPSEHPTSSREPGAR